MARTKLAENVIKALAYLRTSSAQNVGGDSDARQREAVQRFARRHGYELAGEFYDAAVSGADPIETRPGFAAMLERIEADGVRVVLVEDASRFARSVIAQELGVLAMQARGVRVLTAACCREAQRKKRSPFDAVDQATRTEFGRPRSSMRLRTSTVMATSATCASSVWKRRLSPMTRFQRPIWPSTRARTL